MARTAPAKKLAKYPAMRDFGKTKAPSGEKASGAARNSFVIQKHAARRQHYDFRLELDGAATWKAVGGKP